MPPMERAYRRQTAVLWEWLRVDEYNETVVSTPVEIAVRWKWGTTQQAGPQGTPVSVDATAVVAQEITIGSLMFEGDLNEWLGHSGTGSGSAGQGSLLMEVVTYNQTPDLKARSIRRTVGLKWFRDTKPAEE